MYIRGGGGGVEHDQISYIKPLKNQVSDIRPQKKSNIRYNSFAKIRYLAITNQISDISPQTKSIIRYHTPYKIRYQGTPLPPAIRGMSDMTGHLIKRTYFLIGGVMPKYRYHGYALSDYQIIRFRRSSANFENYN